MSFLQVGRAAGWKEGLLWSCFPFEVTSSKVRLKVKLTQSFPHEENISWLPLLNIWLFVKFRHTGGLRFVVSAQRHTEKNGNWLLACCMYCGCTVIWLLQCMWMCSLITTVWQSPVLEVKFPWRVVSVSDCRGRGFDKEQQHLQRFSHRSNEVSPAASWPAAPHQNRPDPTANSYQHPKSTQTHTYCHTHTPLYKMALN